MDNIEIIDLKGGFGLSAIIRNTGDSDISDIEWSIDFGSIVKIGNYSYGTISSISSKDEYKIKSGFIFGIGSGSVKIVANDFSILQKYFVVGPLVFLKSDLGNQIKNYDMLIYSTNDVVKTLDPADAYDLGSIGVISQIYDTLVTFKSNDSMTHYPSLATDWYLSEDEKTWTFNLRQNVKFSNGNDFTAEDVKYSFNRVLTMGAPETGVDWIFAQCMDTNSTTVINDYKVQIELIEPYGGFLSILAFSIASIVDKETVEAHGGVIPDTENIWMKENAVGTGPFMINRMDNFSEILLARNQYYWEGWDGDHFNKIVFKTVMDQEKRVSSLVNGDSDIITCSSNGDDLENVSGVDANSFSIYRIVIASMNTNSKNNEYMQYPEVRQALSYAFNYQSAIDDAFNGKLKRLPGVIPSGMKYYNTQNNGNPIYYYNLTEAERILNEAGFIKNDDGYRFEGTSFQIIYNTGDIQRQIMAETFHNSLTEIGIKSVVIEEDWEDILERMYSTEDCDIVFVGWGADYNDADDFIFPIIASQDAGGDIYNTNWKNETCDNYIIQARHSANPQIRDDSYKQAYDIYIQDPSMIFIGQDTIDLPQRHWLKNYNYNPAPSYRWNFYDCYKDYD